MTEELSFKISNLPDSPGCYIMKSEGSVIYVGKAKNLKNRVRQYFQSSKDHSPKVRAMVSHVDDFELVLADSELEALVLEANLIKKHKPFYNILLKDDKHYPFIAIDPDECFPAPVLRRKRENDGMRYFGPYTGTAALYEVLDAVRTEYPLRICTKQLNPEKLSRPCVHYQTGRCCAPCAGYVTQAEYKKYVDGAITFLSGDAKPVLSALEKKMKSASSEMNYEKAAVYRDRIEAVKQILERQKADSSPRHDLDVLTVVHEGEDALVQLLNVREGKLIGSRLFVLERCADEDESSILLSFILQYYSSDNLPPREILLSDLPEESDTLSELLSELIPNRAKVRVYTPMRGEKHHLVDLARKNLNDAVEKRKKKLAHTLERTVGAVSELAKVLGLDTVPRRIEGYDISNTSGALSVASMVVMIDGLCVNREYRTFRIKSVQGPNDFASIYEALYRRLRHGLSEREERRAKSLPDIGGSFSDMPDLILIDGGHEQVAYAMEALHKAGLDIPLFGLAERIEEIVLPDREDTIILPRTSPALQLIQRLRDEAHRFAITHHRKLRNKLPSASQLDTIPGIGPTRRKALLRYFKTIEELKNADVETLKKANGMNTPSAQAVYAYYHSKKEPGD